MRTRPQVANLEEIQILIEQGAHFYCGHSGGKDSQAMYATLRELIPADRLHVVHADLGTIEWEGVKEHIVANIDHELMIAQAIHADGSKKDLFSAIRARRVALDTPSAKHPEARRDAPAFPSGPARFCTSDLKRDPIWKVIRNDGDHAIVVNCVGIRGAESDARSTKITDNGSLNINKKNTNTKRTAYDWWPLANWNCRTDNGFDADTMVDDVFTTIADAGQVPHPQYAKGNDRLSCVFCILGSVNDLRNGFKARPDLAEKYTQLERDVRGTMFHKQSLAEKINLVEVAA